MEKHEQLLLNNVQVERGIEILPCAEMSTVQLQFMELRPSAIG